jgi:glycosyltransferase involved in cell wall biosynthesis
VTELPLFGRLGRSARRLFRTEAAHATENGGPRDRRIESAEDEVAFLRAAGLFDEGWYVEQHPEVFNQAQDAILFYVTEGAKAGHAPHPLFDPQWYEEQVAERGQAELSPLTHFVLYGADANISPHPLFDVQHYRRQRGDELPVERNPLRDFVTVGYRTGASPHPLFDVAYYHEQAPRIAKDDINPLTHFVAIGFREGLAPNRCFDVLWYASAHQDAMEAGENPLIHFIRKGAAAHLRPHPAIDIALRQHRDPALPRDWLAAFATLVQAGSIPGEEFDEDDTNEDIADRQPHASPRDGVELHIQPLSVQLAPYFDLDWYATQSGESFASLESAVDHYIETGWQQNFAPNYLFDPKYYVSQVVHRLHEIPLQDYLTSGVEAGLSPHPMLDIGFYRREAHLETNGPEPLLHYLRRGARRALKPNILFDPRFIAWRYGSGWPEAEPALLTYLTDQKKALAATHPLFMGSYYWAHSARGFEPTQPALRHYLEGGWRALTPTHPLFHSGYYYDQNRDVGAGGGDPLLHFLQYGYREGRDPSPLFHTAHYERQRPRHAWMGGNPLIDYLMSDAAAWCSPHPDFDPEYFRRKYQHEFDARTTRPLVHYAQSARFRHMAGADDPGSAATLRASLETDSAKPARAVAAHRETMSARTHSLHVTHSLGGGTWAHVRWLGENLALQGHATKVLRYDFGGTGIAVFDGAQRVFESDLGTPDGEAQLLSYLKGEAFDFLHFHQIMGADKTIRALPQLLSKKYYASVHDYYFMCPQVICVDSTERFCGAPEVSQCNRCVRVTGPYPGLEPELREHGWNVSVWRASHSAWLSAADAVFAPSDDTAERIARTLGINCHTRPHPEPMQQIHVSAPPSSGPLRALILGAIGPHKGSDLLLKCALDAFTRGLPIEYSIVGEVNDPERFRRLPNVRIGRRYPVGHAEKALSFSAFHCALFLSIWPETYAYTLSEVMASGVFPMSLNVGAIPARLKAMDWGHLIPLDASPADINNTIMSLPEIRRPPRSGTVLGYQYSDYITDYYQTTSRAGGRDSGQSVKKRAGA